MWFSFASQAPEVVPRDVSRWHFFVARRIGTISGL